MFSSDLYSVIIIVIVIFQICCLYILQRICIYRSKFKGEHGVVFLRGAREFKGCGKGDTSNCHLVFRQEGYFHWYFQLIWSSESMLLLQFVSGLLVWWNQISSELLTWKQGRVFCIIERLVHMKHCGGDIYPQIRRWVKHLINKTETLTKPKN